ncbi:MAG: hypothetical protein R6U51_12225 [Anaerolineales bacterium]
MAVTYTNRRGSTYKLFRTKTKTGKDRYYFAKSSSKGELCEKIPEGFEIRESPNSVVSLAKKRPQKLRPSEVALIQAVLAEHPQSGKYETYVKSDRVVIYERIGPDLAGIASIFNQHGMAVSEEKEEELQEKIGADARYEGVLQFTLTDESDRAFVVERWCYLGGIDDWMYVESGNCLEELATKTIPLLGTDAFYDLY